jgi:hypothetical protein
MAKRRFRRRSKRDFYQQAAQEYMRLNGVSEFDPADVAQWMIDTKQYNEKERSKLLRCKQELTDALRSQRLTDPQGRDVRAMLGARYKSKQGELFSKWAPLFEAKPNHARLSGQQWRRSIRGEVLVHDRTFRSYNENNTHGAQLPLFDYNFNLDRDEDQMPPDYPDTKPENG